MKAETLGEKMRVMLISRDSVLGSEIDNLLGAHESIQFILDIIYPIEKALAAIINTDYALVIVDLPKGQQCIDAVEKLCDSASELPLVVLTNSGFRNSDQVIKSGALHVISKSTMDGKLLVQNIVRSIDRKRIENELKVKDNILQAVNYAAEVFLAQSDWESWIIEVLARLGQASQSDRVYVFQNTETNGDGFKANLHSEWSSEGIQHKTDFGILYCADYESSGLNRWVKLLSQGQMIHSDIEDLPQHEQPLLMKLGVKSLVVVPIFNDQAWWGFIGFDQCRKKKSWSPDEIDALKTAAKIFGAAISRKATEQRLTQLATHDFLTGIPNRMLFEDRFSQAAARADRSEEKVEIISIDLDRFKNINDTYGHPVGDKVLKEVAARLCKTLRGCDTCARIGGDEFGIVAENIHNRADAMRVMEKITLSLKEPIRVDQNEIFISASMGASLYPDNAKTLEGLLSAADNALYQVKGKQTAFKIYNDGQYSWLKD